jgi:hypothetical protein
LCEIVKKHGAKDLKKIARLLEMTYVQVATKLHSIKNMKNVKITDEEFQIVDILKRDRPDVMRWSDEEK